MPKVLVLICSLSLVIEPIFSRLQLEEQSSMLHRSKRASCCFVDIFCYTACFNPRYNLQSLVHHERRFQDSETRRHRHHHQHKNRHHGIRTKRSLHVDILWEKMRKTFEGKREATSLQKIFLTNR